MNNNDFLLKDYYDLLLKEDFDWRDPVAGQIFEAKKKAALLRARKEQLKGIKRVLDEEDRRRAERLGERLQ